MTDRGGSAESPGVAPPSLEQVFRDNYSFVHHSLRRMGVSPRGLDDVAQEVFLTVHNILADFDGSRSMRPWLFGIAYRHALRARSRAHHRREQLDSSPGRDAPADGSERDRRDAQQVVQLALGQLDEPQRAVLIMMDIEGFTAPEVAEALGVSVNTVYSRLRLGRETFAKTSRRLLGGAQ